MVWFVYFDFRDGGDLGTGASHYCTEFDRTNEALSLLCSIRD